MTEEEDYDESDEDFENEEEYDDYEETDEEYQAEIESLANEMAARVESKKAQGLPYVIPHSEFEEIEVGYTKTVLYYYSVDNVLCEEDDTKIETDDEETLVGFDYEDVLEMQTTAWVRNDEIKTLYQIHRIDESYQEI